MARIDHTGHAHPATPDGRRRCREARAAMDNSAKILADREDADRAIRDEMLKNRTSAAMKARMDREAVIGWGPIEAPVIGEPQN